MQEQDISVSLQERVQEALASNTSLCLRGSGSKDFLGREPQGQPLDLSGHRGIINYEPTELVITARSGTTLNEIEKTLAEHNQMMAFEPPSFGEHATLGGTIACNLSGPYRPYSGAARDFLLGTKLLNGKAEIMSFGGEVMKNVAGYDVSRLMAGAMGTLGIMLELSLKVLPRPDQQTTLVMKGPSARAALDLMHSWARLPHPISATTYHDEQLHVRLSGTPGSVRAARELIGGEEQTDDFTQHYWDAIKNHGHEFFNTSLPLWRLSVASDARPIKLDGDWLYEWGGAQRWLISEASPESIFRAASKAGGHATLYRNGQQGDQVFQPLPSGLIQIHRQLKKAFDPSGILNTGRLYQDI